MGSKRPMHKVPEGGARTTAMDNEFFLYRLPPLVVTYNKPYGSNENDDSVAFVKVGLAELRKFVASRIVRNTFTFLNAAFRYHVRWLYPITSELRKAFGLRNPFTYR